MGVWSEGGNRIGGEVEMVDVVGGLVVQTSVDILVAPGEREEVMVGCKVWERGNHVVVDTESIEMGKRSKI